MSAGHAAHGQPQYHSQTPVIVPTYLTQAILVTLFCCLPFGIPAIIAASKVSNLLYTNQYDEAEVQSRQAKKWVNVSFWCGFGYIAIYLIGIAMAAMADM
jgi:hypothetical protein